ncbi:MAG: hypothetical protein KGI51_04790 [Rhodospirillales bacterium]|nr:hypothetical protein [Rhodospirillales bacterium]
MPFASNAPLPRAGAKILRRTELTRTLVAKLHHEEAVIGGIGFANFELWGAGHRPQNFYMLGSMGLAVPIALGVALAQPARRVIALEGDGSVLMQLGALSTIASVRPRNLIVVIQDNGAYQITGGQKAASEHADLIGIARESGLAQSAWAADLADFEAMAEQALHQDGPWVIGCRIDTDKPGATTERDPARIRDQFVRGMGLTQY